MSNPNFLNALFGVVRAAAGSNAAQPQSGRNQTRPSGNSARGGFVRPARPECCTRPR